MREYIKSRGHVETGRLSNSISFNVKRTGEISLNALEYINYLDNGNFIVKFWELRDVKTALADFYAWVVLDGLL